MSLFTRQPRLRLYTKFRYYLWGLLNLVDPFDRQHVSDAERAVTALAGAGEGVFTSMGRTAIYEGLRALLAPGDEVIVSPMTVPEVVGMMRLAGVRPVFCDTRPGTWHMDPDKVESLITPKTRAIMVTHLYGLVDDMDVFRELCEKHGLFLVEDAAQALGAEWKGRKAGTFGKFGIYSFSYPKNISSFYGGMLVSDDPELAGHVRERVDEYPELDKMWFYSRFFNCMVKDIGSMEPSYSLFSKHLIKAAYSREIGALKKLVEVHLPAGPYDTMPDSYGRRPSGLQGRIVVDKIREVVADSRHRIKIAEIYEEGLKGIEGVVRPPFRSDLSHTYLYYPIEVPDRRALQKHMVADDCDVALQHIPNCADLPEYKEFFRDCPQARRTAGSSLMLPTYPKYRLENAEAVVRSIRVFFGKNP